MHSLTHRRGLLGVQTDWHLHSGTVRRISRSRYSDAKRAAGAGITDMRAGKVAARRIGWTLQGDILSVGFVNIMRPCFE